MTHNEINETAKEHVKAWAESGMTIEEACLLIERMKGMVNRSAARAAKKIGAEKLTMEEETPADSLMELFADAMR